MTVAPASASDGRCRARRRTRSGRPLRRPGRTRNRFTISSTADETITPGRSLFGNTAGCSVAPVANTRCRARSRYIASSGRRGHEGSVEDSERGRAGEDAGAGGLGLGTSASAAAGSEPRAGGRRRSRSCSSTTVAGPPPPAPTRPRARRPRRRSRGRHSGGSCVLAGPMVFLARDLAQPCLRPDEGLHERPGPSRPVEDLVVEAGRHHEGELFSQPWISRFTDGHAFCRSTFMPSRTGSVQARTLGIPSICIKQLGHDPVMQSRPRGRWYLNEREVMSTPAAANAEPTVSPSKAAIVVRSNRNRTPRAGSIALAVPRKPAQP